MKVVRDVEPSALADLFDDPPRATVAFVEGAAVDVRPVRVRDGVGMPLFALAGGAPDLHGREVLLVLDAGAYWFELRGISVRGVAERVASPVPGCGDILVWYAVTPGRVLAWDYDALRET